MCGYSRACWHGCKQFIFSLRETGHLEMQISQTRRLPEEPEEICEREYVYMVDTTHKSRIEPGTLV
jgi:hypothetical protein